MPGQAISTTINPIGRSDEVEKGRSMRLLSSGKQPLSSTYELRAFKKG
jgi:hypothetical protein